jgi:hypothetical protein
MKKDFEKLTSVKTASPSGQPQPALIKQIKENSLSILLSHMENLFSSCDDLFFDLSSRAVSNSEQNLYFESMRELRIKKNGVIDNFIRQIEQAFLDSALHSIVTTKNPEPVKADSLSLVHEDDIEQKVAIDGMVTKARGNNQESLYQLVTRLDYLTPGNTITDKNNPLDPRQLCNCFARACELLNINIKAKIIIFKQFDRLVTSSLSNLYSNANDLLINAGVIPNIVHSVSNKNAQPKTAANKTENPRKVQSNDSDIDHPNFDLAALSQLLQNMHHLGPALIPNYQAYSANPGPMMSNEELLTTLTLLQVQLSNEQNNNFAADKENIRAIVDSILKEENPQTPQSIKKHDDDTINLVAMFFDFILDDKNLPVPFQALISRLQIPILKTALRDQVFFSSSQHPARKLVNALSSASIGWGSDEDRDDPKKIKNDKTYQEIANIIQEITESATNNDQIFVDKLQQFQEFVSRNEHRNSLIEKRTHQAAEGQARTRLAKEASKTSLFSLMEKARLPENITEFLIHQWQQFLTITHLKHGEESAEWLDAVQLAHDIIWVCLPQQDDKSKIRFDKIEDELYGRIRSGLIQVVHTEEECKSFLDSIEHTIKDLQQQYSLSNSASSDLKPLTAEQAKSIGHLPGSGNKSWKEMTALERQKARYHSLTYEFIKKVESLPLNTWLTYQDNTEGRSIRCKLAGKVEATDSYIFVNRFGFNVLEKARKEFAYDLQQKRVILLESGLLFDRAMSSITSNLRQLANDTDAHQPS